MRVLFTQPHCAYGIGADPTLDDDEAARLIAMGVCEPYDKPAPPAKVDAPPLPAVEPTPEPEAPAEPEAPPVKSKFPRRR